MTPTSPEHATNTEVGPPAPPPLAYEAAVVLPPRRVWRGVVLTPVLMAEAWGVGALTNLVNGVVSPEYFGRVMGYGVLDLIVYQGMLDATAFGVLLCLVLVPTYCGVTGCRLPVARLVGPMALAVGVTLALHLLFGLVGLTIARFSPFTFVQLFPVSEGAANLARFGYVGGAIWGAYAGGLAAVPVLILGVLRAYRQHRAGWVNSDTASR